MSRLSAGDEVRLVFRPAGRTLQVPRGTLITTAANQAGVAIEQVCGGKGTCGKCKVRMLSGELGPVSESERRHLSEQELAGGYRLACQAAVLEDASIEVPWAAAMAGVSILVEGVLEPVLADPLVQKSTLRVPSPTLADQVADYEALRRLLPASPEDAARPTVGALRELPGALRAAGGLLTVVRSGDLLISVEPGDSRGSLYGFACDIGTTTVVGYLLDLTSGRRMAVASTLNPQTRFGDDVVSRIEVARRDAAGLEALRSAIVDAVDDLIGQTVREAGIRREQVHALSVVGNTCMHHLFLGLSPAALGHSPYVPVVVGPLQLAAADAGLHAHPAAQLFLLPNIAGFVGADMVGVLLATGLLRKDGIRLAIDIGTNGEMALGSPARMLACSTAAGPAFEGAQLSHGMRAADGAIDRVEINAGGELHVHAIGRGKLRGICGSGAVDAIACLRRLEVVDHTGRLLTPDEVSAGQRDSLAERRVAHHQGGAFVLASPEHTAIGGPIVLTQRDIRQIQLGKGAIRAGIEILMKELGVEPEQVVEVCLAGAFGNYVRPASALTIGLIPHFPQAPITPVGNAAGAGAQMALLSRQAWQEAAAIQGQVEHIELSLRPDFPQVFMGAMTLDDTGKMLREP
jgi:uncharacterized 2Fe-2S/4Fe-4S cluster protein (DUF4445 family)